MEKRYDVCDIEIFEDTWTGTKLFAGLHVVIIILWLKMTLNSFSKGFVGRKPSDGSHQVSTHALGDLDKRRQRQGKLHHTFPTTHIPSHPPTRFFELITLFILSFIPSFHGLIPSYNSLTRPHNTAAAGALMTFSSGFLWVLWTLEHTFPPLCSSFNHKHSRSPANTLVSSSMLVSIPSNGWQDSLQLVKWCECEFVCQSSPKSPWEFTVSVRESADCSNSVNWLYNCCVTKL